MVLVTLNENLKQQEEQFKANCKRQLADLQDRVANLDTNPLYGGLVVFRLALFLEVPWGSGIRFQVSFVLDVGSGVDLGRKLKNFMSCRPDDEMERLLRVEELYNSETAKLNKLRQLLAKKTQEV